MITKQKTKISFWASTGADWKDKNAKKIYDKILEVETKLEKVRAEVFNKFTNVKEKYGDLKFRKKKYVERKQKP